MSIKEREKWTGLLLCAPFILGFLVFFVLPFSLTLYYSFTTAGCFTGLFNYKAIYSSALFRLAAWNTAAFYLAALPLITALSLGIALLIKWIPRGNTFKLSLLFPMMLPIASTVMVMDIFFSDKGFLNQFLIGLGLPVADWLNSPVSFWVLVGLYLWKNTGYNVILLLSGLYMIPAEYYDYGKIEGAGPLQSFRHITLPALRPTLFFTLLVSLIGAYKCFREAYLIAGKYPPDSIYLLQHFMNNNFESMNYPRLSASAVTMTAAIALGLLVFLLISKRGRRRP